MTLFPGQSMVFTIDDVSKVGEARREASKLAGRIGFDETGQGQAALVISEIATNLVKHAGAGALLVTALEAEGTFGLEVLALDKGPGMIDVGHCLRDGYSTAGSSGNGLGAIARLSSEFDLHSLPGIGTALMARLWAPRPRSSEAQEPLIQFGVVNVPAADELVCGDAWAVVQEGQATLILVADGLGHGQEAAEAAQLAVRVFRREAARGPTAIVNAAHDALRGTRGAALAVALLDHARREVRFAGIGNIAGSLLDGCGRSISMVSLSGTVGHTVRKVLEFVYPWGQESLLIMHSDGLSTHWRLDRYPGLRGRHPSLSAGVLFRDYKRGRDDVTVLAARERGQGPA